LNAVVQSQDFQQRLFDKIRADIGSLMTDEELKKLVETAMDRMFFTPKEVKNDWGRIERTEAPQLVQIVKELIAPRLQDAPKQWLDEHPDEVKKALDSALMGGLASATLRALDSMLSSQFAQFNLHHSLQNALQAHR